MREVQEFSTLISGVAGAYRRSQILFAGLELGVFTHLEHPASSGEVAAKTGCSPRGMAMLLDGLAAIELLEKKDGLYVNGPAASACLVPGKPGWQGEIVRHSMGSWDAWAGLADCVRNGACGPGDERERDGAALRNFILGMQNIAQFSAVEVLNAMDFSRFRRMLDLAGGPATYSIAFLKAHPGMRATLFDRPPVVEIAREQVAAAGLTDRFGFLSGDCHTDPLGGPHDLVFMSNIIHSFSAAENARLVEKAFQVLEPGGVLVIKDFLTENDRSGPAFSLIFALHMLVHTPGGGTYSFGEVAEWTDAAGFAPGHAVPVTPQTRLWVAEKPGTG